WCYRRRLPRRNCSRCWRTRRRRAPRRAPLPIEQAMGQEQRVAPAFPLLRRRCRRLLSWSRGRALAVTPVTHPRRDANVRRSLDDCQIVVTVVITLFVPTADRP